MELPKNVTQIGEADRHCKIFVEDYVFSYMKQLNAMAVDKEMAVALYGIKKEEGEVAYLFLYGACKLNFLQRESRHLSQAQQQEIERNRRKYFKEYTFLAYRLLNGEMMEGFHVYEQGICRYIAGYSQFYEKNDSMLAYMLDVREEAQPEVVDTEIYDEVKRRQEERRAVSTERKREKITPHTEKRKSNRWRSTAAVLAMLGIIGVAAVNRAGGWEQVYDSAGRTWDGIMQQKLPDAVETTGDAVSVESIVAEDKLTDAILREQMQAGQQEAKADVSSEQEEQSGIDEMNVGRENVEQANNTQEQGDTAEQADTEETGESEEQTVETSGETAAPRYYTICAGDTLTRICVQNYGSDARLSEICALNQITNPDDIKVGQKILLP